MFSFTLINLFCRPRTGLCFAKGYPLPLAALRVLLVHMGRTVRVYFVDFIFKIH